MQRNKILKMLLSEILDFKAYTLRKGIGFFVILILTMSITARAGYGKESEKLSSREAIIRGVVRDRSKPDIYGKIAGARVKIINAHNRIFGIARSNKQGKYEIKLKLFSGRYKIICEADNFKREVIRKDIEEGKVYNKGFDFYLESIDITGELISSEGGEVVSSDGKVKVIIPVGAITGSERISITKRDKNSFKESILGNGNILSVVECKPYGLVFNKPVELIYSLEQAEIPGTAVELGLYDSIQDKIIPTGQTTTVPVDGYTVRFSLMHFSTYACLEYVSTQGAPIGAGVQIPLPDLLTGSFSHAIPITVPPGRKGMQPQIRLSYRSSSPNSWVGLGFSLNSGYIARSTRLGPPIYDDKQDTFYFITEAGTTELVNLTDNLYQAKVESGFTKFFKEADDTWKVVTKDGAVLRFGQTTDSKETSTSGTFSWHLSKAVDTNGNYIEYNYIKDQGKAYLSRIDYTGNETGVSPTNSIEFNLEPREDISSSYISTSRIAAAKRLKEIEAKVKGELVWRYELEYEYSPDSNRSLLKSVKQSGSDGKSLPEQKFSYHG